MESEARSRGSRSRPLRDPFADRASLLLRTLLSSPGAEWSIRGLAEAASVTPMLSSDVVRQLEAWSLVTTRPEGRKLLVRLTQPTALIERWAASYEWQRNASIAFDAAIPDNRALLDLLRRALQKRRWALTLLAGAWQRIRYTPTDRLHIYIECEYVSELREIARREGWVEDPAGRVVLMKSAYRQSIWSGLTHTPETDIPLVSDIQLVLDLWHYPERGRETAEQLWRPIARRFERANDLAGKAHA